MNDSTKYLIQLTLYLALIQEYNSWNQTKSSLNQLYITLIQLYTLWNRKYIPLNQTNIMVKASKMLQKSVLFCINHRFDIFNQL